MNPRSGSSPDRKELDRALGRAGVDADVQSRNVYFDGAGAPAGKRPRSMVKSKRSSLPCDSRSGGRHYGRSCRRQRTADMRTLVHLSDLHFGRIDAALLDPLRTAVLGTKPDLIAISGDFTQRARRSEFAEARRFLASLHAPKLTVPGNHDVPLWNIGARFFAPLDRYK